jgi:hypothetical protein
MRRCGALRVWTCIVDPPEDPEAMDTTNASISSADRREAAYGNPLTGEEP